jgi:predicted permease
MLREFLTRFRGLFHDDVRIEEEISAHLEMLAAEYESRGMTPREARLAARRAFGGVAQVRENWREQRGLAGLEWLRQDLRYARGQMRKHPGFTVAAIFTLALGIGANSLVYQTLDGVVYRPLPVRDPHALQLVNVVEDGKPVFGGSVAEDFSYPIFRELAARQDVAESLIATGFSVVPAATPGGSERLTVVPVSGSYFGGLGARIAMGRPLTPADDRPGAPPVVVLSHQCWQTHFDSSRGAIGRTLRVGKVAATIVGVAAPEFYGITLGWDIDAWIPAVLQPQVMAQDMLADRNKAWLNVIARLKPGVTPARAQAALDALYRESNRNAHTHLVLSPGYRGIPMLQTGMEPLALAALALVAVVLLIACCNLANLVLGRGATRAHEIGVRMALGAGRGRIVRQLFTESVVLAAVGALVGFGLVAWGWPAVLHNLELNGAPLRWQTAVFAALVAAAATCLFGLAPALATTRTDVLTALRSNRRSYSGSRSTHRLGRALIASQMAVSVMLLYGTALLARSLWSLQHRDPGFQTAHLLVAAFAPGGDLPVEPEERTDAFAQPLLDRLTHLPGVISAALCSYGPLGNFTYTSTLSTPEKPSAAENDVLSVQVSPGYFETMGTPIVRGRAITEADRANTRKVVVLSETAARRLFGSADAIGRLVARDPIYKDKESLQVIGVARDILFSGPHDTARSLFYLPLAQEPGLVTSVMVRTAGNPDGLIGAVRATLKEVAPTRDISRIEPAAEIFQEDLGIDQLLAFASGAFGLIALALTAVGIYGVIGYAIACRTREIGIRMALGASRSSVSRLVVREYVWLIAGSAAAGGLAGIAAARLMRGLVFGGATDDYVLLALAATVLAAIAACTGWLPARRATRLDPMVALREE